MGRGACSPIILPSIDDGISSPRFRFLRDKFRAAPNTVLFNSPRAYTDIHGTRANIIRGNFYKAWKCDEHDLHTVNAMEPALHAKRRKLLNLAFTEQSLKATSPIIARHIDRWIFLLSSTVGSNRNVHDAKSGDTEAWSQPVDMAERVEYLVFDILGELCFGESFNTKEPGANMLKEVTGQILNQVAFGYKLSKSPFYNLFLFFQPRGLNRLLARLRKREVVAYNEFVENSVTKRIAAHKADPSGSQKDMFHFLLTVIDPDTDRPAFSDRGHILSETRLLALTGTDTTATTLCGAFFYLAQYPNVLAKLPCEIRTTFQSSEKIELGAKLSNCKYLRACIDESLRIAHPAPSELPQEVLPGGAVIDGEHYPAGTLVGCAAWAMGRDENVYGDDVDVFRPERWIPSDDANASKTDAEVLKLRRTFHPFSVGPMNCAGQNLAVLELQMVLAKTVWALDFNLSSSDDTDGDALDQPCPPVYHVKDIYLSMKTGPFLRFKPRLG
ncbi:cytochrome P450 [Paraphaeosphaeria sporulosa]|uniref:Cytochrome P450 n=1 Tax=Paraphaeosphaeria sporulosa TaxID=1460663 RepID=A0A177C7T2_9PLEO|nr:cytochrome P450 [Paraphaeosphaeria sporulosa]OAG02909.1 cytochrome P450 [Paraphaeosphaeria sporulosa]